MSDNIKHVVKLNNKIIFESDNKNLVDAYVATLDDTTRSLIIREALTPDGLSFLLS